MCSIGVRLIEGTTLYLFRAKIPHFVYPDLNPHAEWSLRQDFKMTLRSHAVIGWRSFSRWFIDWERHLARINLKALLIYPTPFSQTDQNITDFKGTKRTERRLLRMLAMFPVAVVNQCSPYLNLKSQSGAVVGFSIHQGKYTTSPNMFNSALTPKPIKNSKYSRIFPTHIQLTKMLV